MHRIQERKAYIVEGLRRLLYKMIFMNKGVTLHCQHSLVCITSIFCYYFLIWYKKLYVVGSLR